MRHFQNLFILIALCSNPMNAQQKNTITVAGEAIRTIEIKNYVVNIEFKEIVGDNYRNIQGKTIPQLEKEFASALSKVNIDFSKFQKDQLYHITSYTYTTSSFYFYETTSQEEVEKILRQKIEGVNNTKIDIIAKELTNEEIGELSKQAIEDARKRAQSITSKIGKNVGDITEIVNTNYKYQSFYSGRVREPLKYHIKVTFSLK